jgi:hypothetical protein
MKKTGMAKEFQNNQSREVKKQEKDFLGELCVSAVKRF